ncbi:hypothetical protein BD410DRAFT_781490 [Rickenella mellea]|uniref:HMG box domain-containing protein n=1 Tax=Rickenella mellea TaxID=50990 RepID=A0A4Y7QPB8_9AGAM|nr:hypothetical protein BD410DRAFT_781490 [Rickenella mellea]
MSVSSIRRADSETRSRPRVYSRPTLAGVDNQFWPTCDEGYGEEQSLRKTTPRSLRSAKTPSFPLYTPQCPSPPRTPEKRTVGPDRSSAQRIPRPRNAFFLYRAELQKITTKVEHDNRHISTILGMSWKSLSEADKAHWRARAAEEKAKHAEMYPDYRYTPVRREKKKRNVKKTGPEDLERFQKVAQLLVSGKQGDELESALMEEGLESNHSSPSATPSPADMSTAADEYPSPPPSRAARRIFRSPLLPPSRARQNRSVDALQQSCSTPATAQESETIDQVNSYPFASDGTIRQLPPIRDSDVSENFQQDLASFAIAEHNATLSKSGFQVSPNSGTDGGCLLSQNSVPRQCQWNFAPQFSSQGQTEFLPELVDLPVSCGEENATNSVSLPDFTFPHQSCTYMDGDEYTGSGGGGFVLGPSSPEEHQQVEDELTMANYFDWSAFSSFAADGVTFASDSPSISDILPSQQPSDTVSWS